MIRDYIEAAFDSLVDEMLADPAKLRDVTDALDIPGMVSHVFRAFEQRDDIECRRADFFMVIEKAVREYVWLNMAAEISERAQDMREDDEAEAAEARADVRRYA